MGLVHSQHANFNTVEKTDKDEQFKKLEFLFIKTVHTCILIYTATWFQVHTIVIVHLATCQYVCFPA